MSAPIVGKQWLLARVCLGMKVIDIGTASGLKRGLCKAFSTQDIKWCSVDRRLCTNTSDNNTVSYIGPSFNYTEAFSLLRLTVVARTGLQEPQQDSCETCHLSERPFNSLRISYSKR